MNRNHVFISYSHKDADYLSRLKVHLRPIVRKGLIDIWSDEEIHVGDKWRQKIKTALDSSSVAVLLISADFLASEFIASDELPPLLEAAQNRGTRIIPIILKPCGFARVPELALFQSLNDPTKPLIKLSDAEQEDLWDRLAVAIEDSIHGGAEMSKPREELTNPFSDLERTNELQDFESKNWSHDEPYAFFRRELSDLNLVKHFYVYQYHYIDVKGSMQYAHELLSEHPNGKVLIRAIEIMLKESGWEGDGMLELIWLPPFIDVGPEEDTWGSYVWHVKQSNNGTSWLASRFPLKSKRLYDQNRY